MLILIIIIAIAGFFAYKVYLKKQEPASYKLNTTRVLSRKELLEHTHKRFKLKQSPIAIYSISIDRFSGIKTNFSEEVARQVSAEVCKRIQNSLKDQAQLAQIQQHEFCLIITDLDTNHAQTIGANLCQIINDKKLQIAQNLISVSISIGCVYSARNHSDLNELISESVMLMQAAREQGRNHFEYSDMSEVAAL